MATDEALYARARDGDRAALAELVSRYHAPLLAFLYRMTDNEQMAEDLVQDAFVRMVTYDGEAPRSFRAWAFALARNLAYDAFRSASYRREMPLDPEADVWLSTARPGVERTAERHESRQSVVRVLQALRPHHREVLILRFYHDLSLTEIAAVVDAPVGTVKSRLYYALRQAKSQLARQEVLTDERQD